ncbi:MAG TPA: hypothetical protein VF796_24095, partial [Humisphaera sp.]
MEQKRTTTTGVRALLNAEDIRRSDRGERTWYAAEDVVGYLCDVDHAAAVWAELKRRDVWRQALQG